MPGMPQVEFHSGVGDRLRFACRLLRKAHGQGAKLLVTAPAATLDALDRALWTFAANEFIPHVRLPSGKAPDAKAARTPIWLADDAPAGPCPPILVNLGAPARDDLSPFERIIEVLSTEPDDVRAGRERWRDYETRGCAIVHHPAPAGA
jgi:DNA polymerase-3 subunit chi